jgi:hypothetical protein
MRRMPMMRNWRINYGRIRCRWLASRTKIDVFRASVFWKLANEILGERKCHGMYKNSPT